MDLATLVCLATGEGRGGTTMDLTTPCTPSHQRERRGCPTTSLEESGAVAIAEGGRLREWEGGGCCSTWGEMEEGEIDESF